MQREEHLRQPERAQPTGVALHQRVELAVESQRRDALVVEVLPRDELQQVARCDAARPARIHRRIVQQEVGGEGCRRGAAVNDAPPPHQRMAVSAEHQRVVLHQLLVALLDDFRHLGHVLVAEVPGPDGPVELERPAGVVIELPHVAIPAVAGVEGHQVLQVVAQDLLVDLVAVELEKTGHHHVEEPPVVAVGLVGDVVLEDGGHLVLLGLGEAFPDLLARVEQPQRQGGALGGVLEERLFVLAGEIRDEAHEVRVVGVGRAENQLGVMIPQIDPRRLGRWVVFDDRSGDHERARQALELGRPELPGRVVGFGVGLARAFGQGDWIAERVDVLKNAPEQMDSRIDPMLAGHPRHEALLKVRILNVKRSHAVLFALLKANMSPNESGTDFHLSTRILRPRCGKVWPPDATNARKQRLRGC